MDKIQERAYKGLLKVFEKKGYMEFLDLFHKTKILSDLERISER